MRGGLAWLSAVVVALGACAGRSVAHGNDESASGSATGGASGSATGGASGSATGGTDGSPDMRSCELVSDCALVPRSTCCICGAPELDLLTAVNVREAAEWSRRLCAMSPPCQCASGPNPNLVPTCEAGKCVAVDIREHAASECENDADCRVRVTDCCECGSNTSVENLIAVRDGPDYEELVCAPMTQCLACAPRYPPEVSAYCDTGRCALVIPRL